eukprot:Rhum_TRINITY_DN17474_c0_g1::Rhum_TRINITY_DN17474_c0_g1_i1::g.165917::m.165917
MPKEARNRGPTARPATAEAVNVSPAQEPVACSVPANLPLFRRPTDLVFAAAYFFLAASAVFTLYAGCKGQGVQLRRFFDPVCDHAKQLNLDVPLALHSKWQSEVATKQAEFMHYTYCSVNILFALPLAFVMIFGAHGNNWQKFAVLHAGVLMVVNGFALAEGWEAKQKHREVFEQTHTAMAVLPVMLLFRWWDDLCFTAESHKHTYFVSLLVNVYALVASFFVLVTVYEWVIVSHPMFKGYSQFQPLVNQYSQVLTESVGTFGKTFLVKVNELLDSLSK